MALSKISVDDRTYESLLHVLRKQLPGGLWSDHNPADPGIVLLELLTWLGEMALYRMDRVPQGHTDKFTKLVIDPPEPATVDLTFRLDISTIANPANTDDVTIPAGTRLATDFAADPDYGVTTRTVFETLTPATLTAPRQDTTPKPVTVSAREATVITDEVLGVSDGAANRTYRLNPPRGALGLSPGHPAPVLLDFVNNVGDYQPNPEVVVDGVAWELKQSLLTADSRVDPTAPEATRHFMVDAHDNLVRFGDGVFGTIPPAGAEIHCRRYQVLLGPKALIREGALRYVLDPIPDLLAGERLDVSHTDAQGGANFFDPERRTTDGLAAYHRRFRLVTEDDFRDVLLEDFAEYQDMLGAEERILRAVVLMNRRPPLSGGLTALGHVTLLLLAEMPAQIESVTGDATQTFDGVFADTGWTVAEKQAAIDLPAAFIDRIERFLDRRRLITTRLHLEAPLLIGVTVNMHVVIQRDRDVDEMRSAMEQSLHDFLDIRSGGFDAAGWPLGGNVHRSKLFRLIEELDGVDHVRSLTLGPADPQGDVEIGPEALPVLQTATIAVERA